MISLSPSQTVKQLLPNSTLLPILIGTYIQLASKDRDTLIEQSATLIEQSITLIEQLLIFLFKTVSSYFSNIVKVSIMPSQSF